MGPLRRLLAFTRQQMIGLQQNGRRGLSSKNKLRARDGFMCACPKMHVRSRLFLFSRGSALPLPFQSYTHLSSAPYTHTHTPSSECDLRHHDTLLSQRTTGLACILPSSPGATLPARIDGGKRTGLSSNQTLRRHLFFSTRSQGDVGNPNSFHPRATASACCRCGG